MNWDQWSANFALLYQLNQSKWQYPLLNFIYAKLCVRNSSMINISIKNFIIEIVSALHSIRSSQCVSVPLQLSYQSYNRLFKISRFYSFKTCGSCHLKARVYKPKSCIWVTWNESFKPSSALSFWLNINPSVYGEPSHQRQTHFIEWLIKCENSMSKQL